MPKRRERDRPKAAPGSLYNPNKRVLLSYASDEDEDEQPIIAARPAAVDTTSATTSIADKAAQEDANDVRDDGVHDEQMTNEVSEDGAQQDATSAHKNDSSLWTRGGARKNIRTGQWAVLGSLSYVQDEEEDEDEEDYDSTEEEAMAYLRAVRSERQNMPEVLTGPLISSGEPNYNIGAGDYVDFLDDEAYIDPAAAESSMPTSVETTVDPQVAFTTKLIERFQLQRKQMRSPPSAGAVAALDEHHPISFPKRNNHAYADWHRFLRNSTPQSAQIRAMEQNTVFNVLELLQRYFLVRNKDITAITSAWAWALLARLDDVGTMDNDRVWVLREFGKKAILVQLSFDQPEAAEELERQSTGEDGAEERYTGRVSLAADDDGATGDARSKASLDDDAGSVDDSIIRQNTLAILDSIIVIVGEVFGQRDLIEFRRPWPDGLRTEKQAPNL